MPSASIAVVCAESPAFVLPSASNGLNEIRVEATRNRWKTHDGEAVDGGIGPMDAM